MASEDSVHVQLAPRQGRHGGRPGGAELLSSWWPESSEGWGGVTVPERKDSDRI